MKARVWSWDVVVVVSLICRYPHFPLLPQSRNSINPTRPIQSHNPIPHLSLLDPSLPNLSFYLPLLPSSSLPSVFTVHILLPSSTSVRRVVQCPARRLSIVQDGEVGQEVVKTMMGEEVLKGEDTLEEEVRGRWRGNVEVKRQESAPQEKEGSTLARCHVHRQSSSINPCVLSLAKR